MKLGMRKRLGTQMKPGMGIKVRVEHGKKHQNLYPEWRLVDLRHRKVRVGAGVAIAPLGNKLAALWLTITARLEQYILYRKATQCLLLVIYQSPY